MAKEKGGGGTGPSGSPSALERYLAKQKAQKPQRQDDRAERATERANERPKSGAAALEELSGVRSKFKHTSDPLSIPRPGESNETPSSASRERVFAKPAAPAEQPSSLGRWEKFGDDRSESRKGYAPETDSDSDLDDEDVFQKTRLEEVRSTSGAALGAASAANSGAASVSDHLAPAGEFKLAPEVGTRLLAMIIDWIIVGCLTVPMMRAVSALLAIAFGPVVERHADGLDTVASCLVVYFYYGYFYSKKGASPGKMLFNLEVIDAETGKYLTPWKAFFREAIGKFVSMIPFGMGYIIAAFRQDRRALHDLLFDTNVISKK